MTRRSWEWEVPDPNGFLRYERQLPKRRPVPVRIRDWREVYPPASEELIELCHELDVRTDERGTVVFMRLM